MQISNVQNSSYALLGDVSFKKEKPYDTSDQKDISHNAPCYVAPEQEPAGCSYSLVHLQHRCCLILKLSYYISSTAHVKGQAQTTIHHLHADRANPLANNRLRRL